MGGSIEDPSGDARSGVAGPLAALAGGGGLLGLLLASETFGLRNNDMLDLLGVTLPIYAGLILYGLYALLGRFLRSRASRAPSSRTEQGLMRVGLGHTPLVAKIAMALLLLPMVVPRIRRAPAVGSFARRASAFWLLPALVFSVAYGYDAMRHRGRSADRNAIRDLVLQATEAYPVDCGRCERAEALAERFAREWGEEPRLGPERMSCRRLCP